MIYLAMSYTCLASGVIMMSASTFVMYRVYKGSKSVFAYSLMAFTFLDGAQFFACYFISLNAHPIYADGQTFQVVNFHASQTQVYCYTLISLQSWIFGMKYLESAMLYSLTPPCV
jgi:hypothetical protein